MCRILFSTLINADSIGLAKPSSLYEIAPSKPHQSPENNSHKGDGRPGTIANAGQAASRQLI
jgi:hypothetical protein